jgi:hypothetical protein
MIINFLHMQIILGRSDFLIEVSGTIGGNSEYSDVITSLFFLTNTDSYGPYGNGGGTHFRSPLQSNGSIVGFFVNAGDVIDAIGVYFRPKRDKIKEVRIYYVLSVNYMCTLRKSISSSTRGILPDQIL